jgi:hypothetical protein
LDNPHETPRGRAEAGLLDLLGGDRDAADDQPQRLVLPALRREWELGNLRARHVDRILPRVLVDLVEL